MTTRPNPLPRNTLWLGFFGLILASWAWLYVQSRSMGMTLTGRMRDMSEPMGAGTMPADTQGESAPMPGMEAAAPMTGTGDTAGITGVGDSAMDAMAGMAGVTDMAGMTTVAVIVPMWIIMMAAMMGPTFVPSLRTYEDLIKTGAGSRAGMLGVIAGYLAVWFGFGALIGTAHIAFISLDLLTSMGQPATRWFAAALLLLAGAYQFTDVKERCLTHCRSPMQHFLARWYPGGWGGVRMGAHIGVYCVGCCWLIMSLGFVGGAMNLLWMGFATLIMTLEKLPDIGRWLTRPLGIGFVVAAGLTLAGVI